MKLISNILVIISFVYPAIMYAGQLETFDQAKTQSTQTGKPILLEFVHED